MTQDLLDYNRALQRIGGDSEFLAELLTDLVNMVDESFDSLKEAVDNHDYENLKTLSHSLKGASANLSVNRMAEHFLELEDLGAEGQIEGASNLLHLVSADSNELRRLIRKGL